MEATTTVSLLSTLSSLPPRSFPAELSPSYFPRFPLRPPWSSLPSRSFATELSSSYFPQLPLRSPCRRFHLAPSQRSYPQLSIIKLFPTVFPPSTLSSLPSRSFPTRLSPSYFQRFPSRPPCRRFIIAPSQRSSPQAISQGFLSVHLSSLPSRSFATELSSSYFPHLPLRSPCRRFSIAPSQRSFSQTISHGFSPVHPVVASNSLLPNAAIPKLFPTVSPPSTLSLLPISLLPYGDLPELFSTVSPPSTLSSLPSLLPNRSSSQAISHGFPSIHPVIASIPLLPNHTPIPNFPLRPPCRRFNLAPSPRSSPHAISHGFSSVHPDGSDDRVDGGGNWG